MKTDAHRPWSGESGQSLVETTIFLPLLVFIFLGLFYAKGLVDTKMSAIEAARYVAWENSWVPRGSAHKPTHKTDTVLRAELKALGLANDNDGASVGVVLQSVRGTALKETPFTFTQRFSAVDEAAVPDGQDPLGASVKGSRASVLVPNFIRQAFGLSDSDGGSTPTDLTDAPTANAPNASGANSSGGPLGGFDLGGVDSIIQGLFDFAGMGAFVVHGFFARQTNWGHEEDQSVVSSEVVFDYKPGFARLFPARRIKATSAILSHPFHIARTSDETEFTRLTGATPGTFEVGLCSSNEGHLFHLWLYPTGPIVSGDIGSVISTIGSLPKCAISTIGDAVGFLDAIPGIGVDLGFVMPNGTLKSTPEQLFPADTGSSGGGTGGGTGSGVGGGNPGAGGMNPGP